ncbi:flagellar hook-length control protein FliK [Vibrio sp. SCSIO 43137]|uniref:flagellar hook-length control protein FliK n=1 Tax=Vibrio sp. SCSIO 43137 TaxID=3021011 RepID=UPI0023077488|nr:flagellar hook-length control protein FliK [Vibrio sp. SCSIO 43137]WCE28971.1 flagellar hook-length control protein FliK [Vibrio sp. SCSIO 43137]
MNQSSLSISDVGKSGSLLRTGVGEAKVSADSEESGSFLSTLGAIFQSEAEGGEKAVAAQEGSVEASDEAVQLSDVDAEGESIDKLTQGEEETGKVAVEGSADDELSDNADSDTIKTDPQKNALPADKLAQTMDEGNQLLGRLGESRQVLNESRGKQLPPEQELSVKEMASATDKADLNKLVARSEGKSDVNTLTEGEEIVFKNGQAVAVDGKNIAKAEGGEEGSAAEQYIASGEKQLSAQTLSRTELAEQPVRGKEMTQLTEKSASQQGKAAPELDSALTWQDTAKVAPLAAGAATVQLSPDKQNSSELTAEVAAKSPVTEFSLPAGEEQVTDLTSTEGEEVNVATQINWSSQMPEQGKAPIDSSKLATSQTALAQQMAAQGQQLQQHQASMLAQAQAQAVSADKLASQPVVTNAELNAAQIQNASLNPVVVSSNSSAPALKAALAAGASAGVLAAGKGTAKGSNDNRESGLSQQLAGLASAQGSQQAQIKADMQQAVAQSPLQLSREAAGEKVSEQVQMMMSKNLKNIDIRLDPPELGRMQIRMSMNNDVASVHFTVSNPQAREMVEQAMPRLREMMAQQGLQLSDSSVQQQNSGSQQSQYAAGNEGGSSAGNGGSLAGDEANLDESINLDVNIAAKDDGISYYA